MNEHLSEDQLARCLAGQATPLESRHARECPECAAGLQSFADTMSLFRRAVHEGVGKRVAAHREAVPRHSRPAFPAYRWALAAGAAVVLVTLPFIRIADRPEDLPPPAFSETDADAVMNRVNQHLARSVPGPMEPLLLGIPDLNP